MAISTTTTWKIGQRIVDTDVIYHVSFYKLDGIPVRCINSIHNFPVGVIFHILGHGDWIYFNSNSVASSSTIPRILNQWYLHKESTDIETKQVREILSTARAQAAEIMKKLNGLL
jgi:hypothetical protein